MRVDNAYGASPDIGLDAINYLYVGTGSSNKNRHPYDYGDIISCPGVSSQR